MIIKSSLLGSLKLKVTSFHLVFVVSVLERHSETRLFEVKSMER